MEKLEQLITKYKRGIEINKKISENTKTSNIEKNRSSYQLFLLECFVEDLEKLKESL